MLKKIAVAAPSYPASLNDGLNWVDQLSAEAAAAGAGIICFPESFLPGYPQVGYTPEVCSATQFEAALLAVRQTAQQHGIAIIIPMDWYDGDVYMNVAFVIDKGGALLGRQTKNQLDPSEDAIWTPGTQRSLFGIEGLNFGIVICHEGFRYPETVRWAARAGAHVVFHPNLSGGISGSSIPTEWGSKESPYYEKAQMMRAIENSIYFATSNYTLPYPESASAVIDPAGHCMAYQPYGVPGFAMAEIDTEKATGLLAARFRPERYGFSEPAAMGADE